MRRIIDAHCHIYPDDIAPKAVAAVDRFYGGLPAVPLDGTVAGLRRAGAEAGISRFVVCSVATSPHQVPGINAFIARTARESGGAFIGLGTLHPDSDDLRGDFEALAALGLKGVKLHPDIQGFYADDPRALEIYGMCSDAGLPVCLHAGDRRFDYSNPRRLAGILRVFPRLKLIAAHLGGWSVWDEAAQLLPVYPNLTVDTSSSFHWLAPARALEILRAYGSRRVMFGTDYPMWPPQPELGTLMRLELTDEEREDILWRTCAGLFGLSFDAQESPPHD